VNVKVAKGIEIIKKILGNAWHLLLKKLFMETVQFIPAQYLGLQKLKAIKSFYHLII